MSPLTPGIISPRREVPASITRPEYVGKAAPTPYDGSYVTAPEIVDRMRVASKLAAHALHAVATAAKPGRRMSIIGRVIESYAKRFAYGVVRDFTGHGIATSFHSGLIIPHYDDERFDDIIEPGMTFTIEPMLTLGTYEYDLWDDG